MDLAFAFLAFWDKLNPFAGIIEDVSLLMLAFKIVILLFIVQFVRNRFGGGTIVTLLVLGLGYVMLFTNYFAIFGPVMFIYLFISFGFISILFDLSIARPWKKPEMGDEGSEGHSPTFHDKHEQHERISRMRSRGIY
ncbi:MAG: hypothetical protein QXO69_02520 [archaeon]